MDSREPIPHIEHYEEFIGGETVERILKKAEKLREKMGKAARKTIKDKFLMSRYVEDYINLFSSFETAHKLNYP
jgi:hypothetical protein